MFVSIRSNIAIPLFFLDKYARKVVNGDGMKRWNCRNINKTLTEAELGHSDEGSDDDGSEDEIDIPEDDDSHMDGALTAGATDGFV